MKLVTFAAFGAMMAVAGCVKSGPPVASHPHYVIGQGYQANGAWYYPREDYGYDRTGLASVYGDDASPLTTDGEAYDAGALTGASQILQLPCIVQVTNLQTGRQILLRVNDRGPGNPGRILAVTPRAAQLLGIPADGAAEVRVTIQKDASQALADSLGGGIKIAAAPMGGFQAESLAPPTGVASAGGAAVVQTDRANTGSITETVPPLRLPERVTQLPPSPGALYVQSGSFGHRYDAYRQSARLSGLPNAHVIAITGGGRMLYGVQSGPYYTVPQADAALSSSLAAGAVDATIIVQ
ncbi:SPOR domain-containing protein [Acidisoma cellulosilytica]|uniref:SPOR domain-containing protein n=1 Tax=Acidisoma cellulosilyticum TaxID=2802395 RepID=A0A963YYD6_9PROT|nr:SPOR domain-containing protein [Acidisoma cellulosilyticum]MCB8879523.1 SPOR domain-containing protein [Acidisoma cellulosilyticum]